MKIGNELFDIFYPIAREEAGRIKREFGGYLRLYGEDDLINWAFISQNWTRFADHPGAMKWIIRCSMLRALGKAQDYNAHKKQIARSVSLQYNLLHRRAVEAGLIEKNQPARKGDVDRKVSPTEFINKRAEDPEMEAICDEVKEIIETSHKFKDSEREILLRRLFGGETLKSIARSIKYTKQGVHKKYNRSLLKLRSLIQ